MSHDYGIHTCFKLKPNTPKEVVEFFDLLYSVIEETDDALNAKANILKDHKLFKDLGLVEEEALTFTHDLTCLLLPVSSVYFKAYNRVGKQDNVYYSFTTNRYCYSDEFLVIFNYFINYIDASLGDVLYRSVWYENETENLIFYDPKLPKFVESVASFQLGWAVKHPSSFTTTDKVTFPFYNYLDISKQNKAFLKLPLCDDKKTIPSLDKEPGYTFYVNTVKRKDGKTFLDLSKTDGKIYFTRDEAQAAIDSDKETSNSRCVVELTAMFPE